MQNACIKITHKNIRCVDGFLCGEGYSVGKLSVLEDCIIIIIIFLFILFKVHYLVFAFTHEHATYFGVYDGKTRCCNQSHKYLADYVDILIISKLAHLSFSGCCLVLIKRLNPECKMK